MYNKSIALILLSSCALSAYAMEHIHPLINLPADIKDETLKRLVSSAQNVAELNQARDAVKTVALVSKRYKRFCNTQQTELAYATRKQELSNYQDIQTFTHYNELKNKLKDEERDALILYYNDITIKDDLISLFKKMATSMPCIQFITFNCETTDTTSSQNIIDLIDQNFNYGLTKYTFQIDYLESGKEESCSMYFEYKMFNSTSDRISRTNYCFYDRRNNNDYTPHSNTLSLAQTLQEIESTALTLDEEKSLAKKQKTEIHSQE